MESILVSAVMPCLNEARTLPLCIAKITAACREMGVSWEIVVGDNGSTDGSPALALELGARVVHQPVRGYGAAIRAAVDGARGRYIIMADADDSYDWSRIRPFVDALEQGAELVMGNRFQGTIHPGAMPWLHYYVGNPLLSRLASFVYGIPLLDFHCGMRGFTRSAFERMSPTTDGMEFATEMVIRAARERLRIAEIPIDLHPDKRDRPPHLRSFRDGWRHLRFIMTYAPDHLYLLPGLALFLGGWMLQLLLVGGPIHAGGFYLGSHFLALGLLASLSGLNIVSMGVIAKVVLAEQSPRMDDRVVAWLRRHFTLERGAILGLVMLLVGVGLDFHLLLKWLGHPGSMEDSVHLAFVSTGLAAMGLNVIFGAFLLALFLKR